MGFNTKIGKVLEDGTLSDGTNTITKDSRAYHIMKSKIENPQTGIKRKKTKQELETAFAKKKFATYRWFKIFFQLKGMDMDKSGYKALMNAVANGVLSMDKVLETMKTYKNKTITGTIVDISLGIETEKSKKRIDLLNGRKERARLILENKEKRLAEKEARLQERAIAKRTRDEKTLAELQAKIQMNLAKDQERLKEIEKKRALL